MRHPILRFRVYRNILLQYSLGFSCMRNLVNLLLNSLRRKDYTDQEWEFIVAKDLKRNVVTIEDVVPILESNNFNESFTECSKRLNVSVWSERRVDYIFGKNVNFTKTSVCKTVASDHYPVYADFKL